MTAGLDQERRPSELGLLPAQPPPLADVRTWLSAELARLGEDHLSVVLLVANELVTNAYEHARSPLRIGVHHLDGPCRVRVEIVDGSDENLTPGRSRFGDNRGRGLVLVDRLAHAWDVDFHHVGKTVWAEIDCGEGGIDRC
ncbi:MAG TPA: ATP-binding protein [Actinophytocola sp.]|jgi:anti-sigma regulatory factor (Ser/Thr protein kinase)|uniref:ATP-binding protein n=1 Tax=Actinophytocola sp. TaxID=1872138 RepID=UPI002F929260